MRTELSSRMVRSQRERESGQILVIFTLFVVVLFGIAALAIDVSRAYSDLRFYRATADAASLAGAQDLQQIGSRSVQLPDQKNARDHALEALEQRLGGTATGCGSTNFDVIDCQIGGTPFLVTIKTPSPSCSTCDPERSVQVNVRNPDYGLTFARVLGSNEWDVGTTSVSGLVYGSQYAIITLRPPEKVGSTLDVNDISLTGGTVVTVETGDVGSNANMVENASSMVLDSGYRFYYYPAPPPDDDPGWTGDPIGAPHILPILDPGYTYPAMFGSLGTETSHTFSTAKQSDCEAPPDATIRACTWAGNDPACLAEATTKVPAAYDFMPAFLAASPSKIYCYRPGVYDTNNANQFKVASDALAILLPGVYYFKSGLDVSGRLIGGYEAGSKGVALMFDEVGPGNNGQNIFSGNNALTISLNAGTRYPATATSGTPATAAIDWDGQPVQTSGPSSPDPAILMTLLVKKDTNGSGGSQACVVPTSGQFIEPAGCLADKNKTINIQGNGNIILEGVQYMPTDNVEISGSSTSNGRVGQIVSWTLKYSGGIKINQEYAGSTGNGILRIDAACSAPSEPCTP